MHRFSEILAGNDRLQESPAAIVLRDTLSENIARMQRFADSHGKSLRPHVKTHKSIDIGCLQIAAGAHGITAGTVGEAEVFAEAGVTDIFIAYPLWAAGSKAGRLRSLACRTKLSIGVESRDAADTLSEALGELRTEVSLVIEIECGAGRSGVDPRAAGALARYAVDRGFPVPGVYTYPGHGGVPGERRRAARDQEAALTAAVHSIEAKGLSVDLVSAGSTPTAEFSIDRVITEIRPGEYVFNDGDNLRLGACRESDIALFVAATVVSAQEPGRAILDVGSKALGREGDAERGFGTVPGLGHRLHKLNEYHGYLELLADGPQLPVGTMVPVLPNHVCPVVNSFDELTVVMPDGTCEMWPVSARGRLN
ncbi:alanine racemase [Paramicrobacterium chengjingii]|uniref:Alanine racemase n=1 Tax=Paramicrobacterium chengjingii TaxID=2769067 RepID=A0ABX6YP13_9MICO|nr:alanine racemase [Microbacterium chengjingii]QPZ40022.1 alanine racemase [Microbacterium chengjingii]